MSSASRVRIGVSACLLGERVRYDAGHKRDPLIADRLAEVVEWVPLCPEVAIGMGVPRPPIRLLAEGGEVRAVGLEDRTLEVTAPLKAYGRRMAAALDDVDGYVFKARSPSCGTARVKLYSAGRSRPRGTGLFAMEIMARRPLLPVADEDELQDPAWRDNFLERVFAHRRWRRLLDAGCDAARLMAFHADHKLSLMAHGAVYCRALGRLAADDERRPPRRRCDEYGAALMAALKHPATPKRHANVLQHLMGYFKRQLDAAEKRQLLEAIEGYRLGTLPLSVPQELLRHHARRFPHPYVARQLYLYPEPEEARARGLAQSRPVRTAHATR